MKYLYWLIVIITIPHLRYEIDDIYKQKKLLNAKCYAVLISSFYFLALILCLRYYFLLLLLLLQPKNGFGNNVVIFML